MDKATIILGKKVVSRKETLEYARDKFGWKNSIIGISAYFGFWAWVWGRLTGRKVIYYCIDFYSPKISEGFWDSIFIWSAMQMDRFLVKHCDEVWDISERINGGRAQFGAYRAISSKIVPLSYPSHYLRTLSPRTPKTAIFIGLCPYGLELFKGITEIELVWLGKDKLLPTEELLDKVAQGSIGVSLWKEYGNNYYGDPGKTKLYSACGLPVIMTGNTPYAKIIKETGAGIVIDYEQKALREAIKTILSNYDFFKQNVKKTWRHINADNVFRNL